MTIVIVNYTPKQRIQLIPTLLLLLMR